MRDFDSLADQEFDLLVIGGGIYGAWTALYASLRGLKVALVEKGDWGSGTSSASSKLIHGGLRYLEQFKLGLVKKSLGERENLQRIAPHLVQALQFFVPVYEGAAKGRLMLGAGLTLYDFLAGKRGARFRHQAFGPDECKQKYPFIEKAGLSGGFTYWDAQTDDFRFTFDVIKTAVHSGVSALHYAEAVDLIKHDGRVAGVRIKDAFSERIVDMSVKVVVNTAGPWADKLAGYENLTNTMRFTKGVHLVMPALPTKDAMLLPAASDGRVFFLIPWYDRTLLGTTDTDFYGNPDEVGVDESDVDYLLSEAGDFIKEPGWQRSDVFASFAGVRALINEPGKPPSAVSREWFIAEPCPGLIASIGGKFTSARIDCQKIVDRVVEMLGPAYQPKDFEKISLLLSSPDSHGNAQLWHEQFSDKAKRLHLDDRVVRQIFFRYGKEAPRILSIISGEPDLARRLVDDLNFIEAEVVYAAQHEMAVTLEDILRRRLPIMILARADISACRKAASLAAPILGWSSMKQEQEVASVMERW